MSFPRSTFRRPPRPLRWWLGSFALAVGFPLLALLLWMFWSQVEREQVDARETALRIAEATAERLTALHGDSLALLERMAARPAIRDFDGHTCDSLFGIVDFFPQYANLFLFDRTGHLVCAANPTEANDRAVSAVAGRWVEEAIAAGRLQPGKPMMRVVGSQWVSVLSVPVAGSDGGPRGTLIVVQLPEILGRDTLPRETVVTIVDAAGTVVARTDNPNAWIGRSVRGNNIADLVLRRKRGRVEAEGIDGVSRQYGFTSIPQLDWFIYVGVPTSAVMESVRRLFVHGLAGGTIVVAVVAVLALLMSRAIVRPINELANAAESVARGGYNTVGTTERMPRELARLAGSFNEMIETRTAAERELQDREQRLKALSERLLTIQEEERTRIARSIHDNLGQSLTALKMDVGGLLVKAPAAPDTAALRDRIERTLDDTVAEVQRIASELRPSILDDLGLMVAIEAEGRLFEERTGIEWELSLPQERLSVPPPVATAVYRIFQEAMTNVFRHSGATRVEVRVRDRGDALLLEVRDDGRGVTADEIDRQSSLGLIGIRERAAMIDGTVQIEGIAGRGTIVSVSVPHAVPKGRTS